ncbi:ECF transporter S component [Clostridium tarantellae]|uniref:ECF transporter S component n=1 Tax=Clostridium tarantellae TaxID=39493 RepID=A0A6I1ML93_9CLOT|nr:ECF transporter S component [Clostridium tarantellae]MPQ44175.1 hypothetical protein [Clostridium tarantellae]
MKKYNTKRLVNISLFAAICFIGTWIHFPINIGGGTSMIHLGTTAIFLAAIFLGEDAAWAGAIGCALFDATNPQFAAWVIPTFILKGLTGYVAGKIAYLNNSKGKNFKFNILAFIVAGLVSLLGYFIVNWFVFVGFYGALLKMTTSIITTTIAIIISIPLVSIKPIVNKAIGNNR